MADMLVKLYDLGYADAFGGREPGVAVHQACIADKDRILDFVAREFPKERAWPGEAEYALFHSPVSCLVAVKDGVLLGFACWDATAKGFFGPMGVCSCYRGKGIGKTLLLRALFAMREYGYAYAVIGWPAKSAVGFYQHSVNAVMIGDSPPGKSIYQNMILPEL